MTAILSQINLDNYRKKLIHLVTTNLSQPPVVVAFWSQVVAPVSIDRASEQVHPEMTGSAFYTRGTCRCWYVPTVDFLRGLSISTIRPLETRVVGLDTSHASSCLLPFVVMMGMT